ncbi:MAG: glutamine synthetase family protein [Actinomycetota bacterium]|jgi:glutamine synthetase|nr:glutamine synthetase family protein [Actinomycetota bacterium]
MQDLLDEMTDLGLHTVRVVFSDQHGHLRGKAIPAAGVPAAVEAGVSVPGSLLLKDTGGSYCVDLWDTSGNEVLDEFVGARSVVLRPDLGTLRVLPWVDGTGLLLSDLVTTSGEVLPICTRTICKQALGQLDDAGHGFRGGLELEYHLFRSDPASAGGVLQTHAGWDLLNESDLDRLEPILAPIRAGLEAMGFPPRSTEVEHGPSQIEMTFDAATGIDVADQAVLIRAAIKRIARLNGHHATFMSRPAPITPGSDSSAWFPSGWHLHQSLSTADVHNTFVPVSGDELLSDTGRYYIAGLLGHAAASCLLTTPTVNGYKRYRPRAITPDRLTWSREHRGAMLRVIGGPGDSATRLENRAGDPAANPYLYVASQVLTGLDGLRRQLEPPPATLSPYSQEAGELLPRSLGEAIDAFAASDFYRETLGADVAHYLLALKQSEWGRFQTAVTDWEQREYFSRF